MQILVLGASRVGLELANRLVTIGHEAILLDSAADEFADELEDDVITIPGVIIDIDALREAGIESVDAVCAVSDSQNQNLMAAEIAHKIFRVPKVAAGIFEMHKLHIFDEKGFVSISSTELAVDAFILEMQNEPEQQIMERDICRVFGAQVRFTALEIGEDFDGVRIEDIEDTQGRHVFGIERGGRLILSRPENKVQIGDRLILAEMQI